MKSLNILGGGWAWVRLGKIKCAAKALARVAACSSFNFAKGWHFVCHLSVRLLSVVLSFRVSANVSPLCVCCELRNGVFSAKIIFLAKDKRQFCTFLAIAQNGC